MDGLLEGLRVDARRQAHADEAAAELVRIDIDGKERSSTEPGPVRDEGPEVREHRQSDHRGVDRTHLVGLDGDAVAHLDVEVVGGLPPEDDLTGPQRRPTRDHRERAPGGVASGEDRRDRSALDLGGGIELEHGVVDHLGPLVEGGGHGVRVGVPVPASGQDRHLPRPAVAVGRADHRGQVAGEQHRGDDDHDGHRATAEHGIPGARALGPQRGTHAQRPGRAPGGRQRESGPGPQPGRWVGSPGGRRRRSGGRPPARGGPRSATIVPGATTAMGSETVVPASTDRTLPSGPINEIAAATATDSTTPATTATAGLPPTARTRPGVEAPMAKRLYWSRSSRRRSRVIATATTISVARAATGANTTSAATAGRVVWYTARSRSARS